MRLTGATDSLEALVTMLVTTIAQAAAQPQARAPTAQDALEVCDTAASLLNAMLDILGASCCTASCQCEVTTIAQPAAQPQARAATAQDALEVCDTTVCCTLCWTSEVALCLFHKDECAAVCSQSGVVRRAMPRHLYPQEQH